MMNGDLIIIRDVQTTMLALMLTTLLFVTIDIVRMRIEIPKTN